MRKCSCCGHKTNDVQKVGPLWICDGCISRAFSGERFLAESGYRCSFHRHACAKRYVVFRHRLRWLPIFVKVCNTGLSEMFRRCKEGE